MIYTGGEKMNQVETIRAVQKMQDYTEFLKDENTRVVTV
ncbi:hypothetical protein UF75_2332 [Desulfosporosinus sp. I2]|nr:hypothetical protein UF75_2332 [Desulfosporosinus sp. I2]